MCGGLCVISSAPAATPVKPAKAAKTPRSQAKKEQGDEEHDPYDIDTEMERHPEPLKNIQVREGAAEARSKYLVCYLVIRQA